MVIGDFKVLPPSPECAPGHSTLVETTQNHQPRTSEQALTCSQKHRRRTSEAHLATLLSAALAKSLNDGYVDKTFSLARVGPASNPTIAVSRGLSYGNGRLEQLSYSHRPTRTTSTIIRVPRFPLLHPWLGFNGWTDSSRSSNKWSYSYSAHSWFSCSLRTGDSQWQADSTVRRSTAGFPESANRCSDRELERSKGGGAGCQ